MVQVAFITAGRHNRAMVALVLAGILLFISSGLSAQAPQDITNTENTGTHTAQVILDGRPLFSLRGITSFPAKERASLVRRKIIAVADDPSLSVEMLTIQDQGDRTNIYAGNMLLVTLVDPDAEIENIQRQLLADVVKAKIADGISRYRHDRSSRVLLTNTAYALGLTAVVFLVLWGTLRLFRWLDSVAVRHVGKGAKGLASKSHQLIKAKQIWSLVAGLLRSLRFITMAIVLYFYLNTLLGLYPWTRPAALVLFDLVLNPIESLWFGFVAALPDLFFLLILYVVVRYVLRLMRTFFRGIETGRITLSNFDSDWAMPTYKILRLLTIAFSVVIAYPYIPGSDSAAFKGVSLFLGVIFSLGSSSFISNMMAGMAMTYRSAFKDGDIIRVGDVMGRVVETKSMVTRVITVKNESIVIPNSNILNSNVINYSVLAREQGLVIHSTVGIGYDAPWRQVEAMLLMAADRTNGLKKDPPPFVLQLSMGDFAVNYQINGFCEDEARMLAIKSDLHRNIQDVFNEHGVQIMSPNYENDPETPKVVPPDQWYAAPAVKPK